MRRQAIPALALLVFSLACHNPVAATPSPNAAALAAAASAVSARPTVPGPCQYAHTDQGQVIPDERCTPGAINALVNQNNITSTICVPGWSAGVRPPTSYTARLEAESMTAYNSPGTPNDYEFDHRIPISAGGDPLSTLNLWPQPWEKTGTTPVGTGAESKDRIEVSVHNQICRGTLTLAEGEAIFVDDFWQWSEQHSILKTPVPSNLPED